MCARSRGILLAILLLGSVGLAAASDRPPRNLHLVGDHWTAWNPPTPPADAQVHVVVKGDTLWDLAKHYYGDPYLWPQLWERNQYVQDAHWIYPGDPLALGPQVQSGDNVAGLPSGPAEGEKELPLPEVGGVASANAAAGAPIPLGSESDIYCSGYLSSNDSDLSMSVVGSESDVLSPNIGTYRTHGGRLGSSFKPAATKYSLNTGEIVYLDGGRDRGLTPGTLLAAVHVDQEIFHPWSGESLGHFHRSLGQLRVLSVQEKTAIAEIALSCDPVLLGSKVRRFEAEPVPLGRPRAMRPVNMPAAAEKLANAPTIVYAKDNIVSLGQDHVVFIDRGAEQDVTPGDVFTIYRENKPGLPPVVLGELAVLSVQPRSALARIITSRLPIYVGDRLDLKK
jgi:hypothetical protein